MVDPVTGALIGSAVLGAASNVYGAKKASDAAKDAQAQQAAMMQEVFDRLDRINIPSEESMRIMLETPELLYDYIPEMEELEEIYGTSLSEIQLDPRMREAQFEALTQLREQSQGGLTPADRAELNDIRRNADRAAQSKTETVIQNMKQRGASGSGLELAAQLNAQQEALQTQAEQSDRMAIMQQQAKRDALDKYGQMATQMRGQEYGEAAQEAKAEDLIRQFNLQQSSAVRQRNVERANQAARERELQKQRIHEVGAETRNVQEQANKSIPERIFEMEMKKAKPYSDAATGYSKQIGDMGATKAKNVADMWSGIGDIATGAGTAYATSKKKEV